MVNGPLLLTYSCSSVYGVRSVRGNVRSVRGNVRSVRGNVRSRRSRLSRFQPSWLPMLVGFQTVILLLQWPRC
jgi:hypothetical protein